MSHAGSRRPGTIRTGGRSAKVKGSVLEATREELIEHGYSGLSTARIADRAGVHRSTVHRRWPELDDLVAEALLDEVGEEVPDPDTGSAREDLRQLLGSIARTIDGPGRREFIRTLLADSSRSPEIAGVAVRVWQTRFQKGEKVIERAISRGEFRAGLDPALVLGTFIGPLYLRLLFSELPIDAEFIEETVDLIIAGTATPE